MILFATLGGGFSAYAQNDVFIEFARSSYTVNESAGSIDVDVVIRGAATATIYCDWGTQDGSATAGRDFTASGGGLSFNLGENAKTVSVPIIDNGRYTGNRSFRLYLVNPYGDADNAMLGTIDSATVTIVEDEEPTAVLADAGEFSFTSTYYQFAEFENTILFGNNYRDVPYAMITVNRLNGSKGRVLVDYYTTNLLDAPGVDSNQVAMEIRDYTPVQGTLIFDHLQTSTNFLVPIWSTSDPRRGSNDPVILDRQFGVVLANPRPDPTENPDLITPTINPQGGSAIVSIAQEQTGERVWFRRLTYRMDEYRDQITVRVYNPIATNGCVRLRIYSGAYGFLLMAGSDYAEHVSHAGAHPYYTDGTVPSDTPQDYVSQEMELTLPAGGFRDITIVCLDDSVVEFNEDILLEMDNQTGCTPRLPIHPLASSANLTILFDEQPAGAADREWNPAMDPNTNPDWNPNPGANGEVMAVVVQPDGRQIIAGAFTAYNTYTRHRIARILSNGANDPSFNPGTGANGYIMGLALYGADTPRTNNIGKIVAVGDFTAFNGINNYRIARLNPDGSLDATFKTGNGANGAIRTVALQSDGKIVVGGDFTEFNGEPRAHVARLNEDGSVDLTFNPGQGADGIVWSIDVLDRTRGIFVPRTATGTELEDINIIDSGAEEGNIVIEYDFLSIPDSIRVFYQDQRIFDLFTNGTGRVVLPYGPGTNTTVTIIMNQGIGLWGTAWAYKVTVLPKIRERTIYLGGEFTTYDGQMRNGVVRVRDNGSLDEAFDPRAGADNTVYALAVQGDGRVLIGGAFTDVDFRNRNGIARLMRDGSLDTEYDPGTGFDDTVLSIYLQPDGKAMIGGYFQNFNQTRRIGLARLFQSGVLDTSFMDTAYNQFAGPIQKFSWAPPNKINAVVPYSITNSQPVFTEVVVTNIAGQVMTNLVLTSTNLDISEYVMIGGSFTNVGGNMSSAVTDGYSYSRTWTRQDKVVRFNIARLIGGYTPGPGNIQFWEPEYRADEFSSIKTIKMQRVDGRLGTLQGTAASVSRVAESNVDYVNTSVTNSFFEWSGWTRSMGYVGPEWFVVNINDDFAIESDETVDLLSFNPVGSIYLGGEYIPLGGARGRSKVTLTIVDDDVDKGIISFDQAIYSVNESTNKAYISLIRTNGSEGRASVEFRTVPSALTPATAGQSFEPEADYLPMVQRVEFPPGVTNRVVEVTIHRDNRVEPDEYISLVLTNAEGASLPGLSSNATEVASLLIIDNDFLPGRLNFSSATYQTNEGAGVAIIPVTRSGGSLGRISVDASATAGTATAFDFIAVTTNLVWNGGDTTPKYLVVPILNDLLVESNKAVNLALQNVSTNGGLGVTNIAELTIVDNDAYGVFNFSQAGYEADEIGTTVLIPVVRSQGTNGEVQVTYQVTGGTATAGADFAVTPGTLTFLPGELSKIIAVTVIDDTGAEGIETVELQISITGDGSVGSYDKTTLYLVDNESLRVPAGSLDDEFLGNGEYVGANRPVYALARQVDGRLLAGGDFTAFNHNSSYRLARILGNGVLDSTFNVGSGPNRTVRAIKMQDDNRVLIGGFFTSINGTNRNYVARLNQDGGIDNSFNPGSGADKPVYAIETLRDGRIVVVGSFANFNGIPRSGIAVLNTNGSVNVDFNPGVGADGTVYAVAIQPDGRILIGGDFTRVQNVPRNGIARFMTNGKLDLEFDPGSGFNGAVRALALQRNGGIIAGGSFTSINGVDRNFLARLHDDGRLDDNFLAGLVGADNSVYALALQPDGKIVVAGDFTTFNGVNRSRITRLNPDGRTDPSINFGLGANNFIAAVLVQPNDRKLVLAGGFTQVDGQPKDYIARVHGGSIAGEGVLEFGAPQYFADEFSEYGVIQVVRRGGLTNEVSVDVVSMGVTAVAGADYFDVLETVTFPEGEAIRTVLVPIIDDEEVEDPEEVRFILDNFQGAGAGELPETVMTILSDDSLISFQAPVFAVNENEPGGFATITVVRRGSVNSSASVDYLTRPGTATPNADYTPVTGSLLFNPGQNVKQFTVPVQDDLLVEGRETVYLFLTNASANGLLGDYRTATLQIGDDELIAGELNFSAPAYAVLEYQTNLAITVVRSGGDSGIATVQYQTSDGTARGGLDYRPISGNLSFHDGETVKTINLPILPDHLDETNETVVVTLLTPGGGAILGGTNTTTVTIHDVRLVNGNLNFAVTNLTVSESVAKAQINVTRTLGSNGLVQVDVVTAPGTALPVSDYQAVTNTLSWSPGDTTPKTFTVTLNNDDVVETNEFFSVRLVNTRGGATLGARPEATITITDEDVGPGFLGFASATYSVDENATNATITVTRTLGQTGENRIRFRTIETGTAVAGVDFDTALGELIFADGQLSHTFTVRILDNSVATGNKTVGLELFEPSIPASTNGQIILAELTIVENEAQAGSVDPSFVTVADGQVYAIALHTNLNKFYVGGDFATINGLARSRIARVNGNGSLDVVFDPTTNFNNTIRAVVQQNVTNVIVGGMFRNVAGTSQSYLARVRTDGGLDTNFVADVNNSVHAIALQNDGKVLIGGAFTIVNGLTRSFLARLDATGATDTSFSAFVGADDIVRAIAVQRDGKIVIGGDFEAVNGMPCPGIARLTSSGQLDLTFEPGIGVEGSVHALAIQDDGSILVAGRFTAFDGLPFNHLVRLTPFGAVDPTFQPGAGANEWVAAVAVEPNTGKIWIGGGFTAFNGITLNRLARLTANGSVDTTINFGYGANNYINTITLQPDGKAVIGGGFTEFDGVPRQYLARIFGGENLGAGSLVFSAPSYRVNEGVSNAVITVRRLLGGSGSINVEYGTTEAGTAIPGLHYVPVNGNLTFQPGETIKTFSIPLVDDQTMNVDRTVGLALANPWPPQTATLGVPSEATLTIANNDDVISFTLDTFSVSENSRDAIITVQRAGGSVGTVTVDYLMADGTATNGVDYQAVSGTLVLNDGVATANFLVPIFDDLTPEPNEAVVLLLTNVTGTATLGRAGASLVIVDDDFSPGMLSFAQAVFVVSEQATNAIITVSRSAGSSGAASVSYSTANGTAIDGADYAAVSGQLAFLDNEVTKDFLIPIYDDVLREGNETVQLTLSNPVGGQLGIGTATLIIQADEATFNFAQTNFIVSENITNAVITVVRSPNGTGPVSVDYITRNGTATNLVDYTNVTGRLHFEPGVYSNSFLVPIVDDLLGEDNEFFYVALTNHNGETALGTNSLTPVTIVDNDVSFVIDPANYLVNEGSGSVLVTVLRRGRTNGVASVAFSTGDGTAVSGSPTSGDYGYVGERLVFGDGQISRTVTIPIYDDTIGEGNEFCYLSLSDPSPGASVGEPGTGILTIIDNEDSLSFAFSEYFVDEGVTNARIQVMRTGVPRGPITVSYETLNIGSASPGQDYTNVTGQLNFTIFEFMKEIVVPIVEDTLAEGDENFRVRLYNLVGSAVLISSNAAVTIVDNDVNLSLSAATYTVQENATNALITVIRQGGLSNYVSVTVATTNITAQSGMDYLGVTNLVSFLPGVATQQVAIRIIDDLLIEGNETFHVQLVNPAPTNEVRLGTVTGAVVTIADNDASIIIASGVAIESEANGPKNGRIDPGEQIQAWFGLRNIGNIDALNLQATLLATNGITPLVGQGTATYPPLIGGGITRSKPFGFTANGTNGARIAATFMLQDGTNKLGLVSFPFTLGEATARFANSTGIIINDNNTASPYPSTITVSNVNGRVSRVAVTLNNLTHSYPEDVDVLLVSPAGQKIMLMSDAGGKHPISSVNLTFDSTAAKQLPDTNLITSGTYLPSNFTRGGSDYFPAPAPQGNSTNDLGLLAGQDPNGIWALYVVDDTAHDSGSIAGGWSLAFTMADSGTASADLQVTMTSSPDEVLRGQEVTYCIAITNGGPAQAMNTVLTAFLPTNTTHVSGGTYCASNHSVVISLGNVQDCGYGVVYNVKVRLLDNVLPGTLLENYAVVTSDTIDLHPENNSTVVKTKVSLPPAMFILNKPDSLVLSWPFMAGNQFELWTCTDLQQGNWVKWTGVQPVQSGERWTITLPPVTTGNRFYQLRLP